MNSNQKAAGHVGVGAHNSELSMQNSKLCERGIIVLLVLFLPLLLVSNPRIAATDEAQYYVYLTSLRFDGDLNFADDYQRLVEINPNAGIENLLTRERIRPQTRLYGNIAPIGSAILWSPFFLLADLFVHGVNLFGAHIPADGFSKPYIRAVCYGSALYGLLGLLVCYRLARRYTAQFASSLATITIWLATPLVFYMFVQMAFAHANGFFLVALFLYVWQATRPANNHQRPRTTWAWAALGIIGGMMTITREQLGLFLLLPAIEAFGAYWRILRHKPSLRTVGNMFVKHVLFLALFGAALVPQLVTYQILNGSPRPASEVGGKFNLCSPHMIDTLIDYNPAPSAWCHVSNDFTASFPPFAHGAFVWSPVLPLALLGLVLLWRRDRLLGAGLLVAFLAQTYVNGAFGTTWHLSSSFGFRRLIECTPVLIIGLALLLEWAATHVDRRLLALVAIGLVVWNFGLIANWTVLHIELRKGLAWPALWRWQIEVPYRLAGSIGDLLFHRCTLMKNGC